MKTITEFKEYILNNKRQIIAVRASEKALINAGYKELIDSLYNDKLIHVIGAQIIDNKCIIIRNVSKIGYIIRDINKLIDYIAIRKKCSNIVDIVKRDIDINMYDNKKYTDPNVYWVYDSEERIYDNLESLTNSIEHNHERGYYRCYDSGNVLYERCIK